MFAEEAICVKPTKLDRQLILIGWTDNKYKRSEIGKQESDEIKRIVVEI